jgi:hypothetical protein
MLDFTTVSKKAEVLLASRLASVKKNARCTAGLKINNSQLK